MKTALELYPPDQYGHSYFSDYQPIVDNFGTVVVQTSTHDYQGDTFVLYRDGDRFGYLCFGWGSCSGCDSLQACDTHADVQSLMERLRDDIIWRESAREMLGYLATTDWQGKFQWRDEAFRDFMRQSLVYVFNAWTEGEMKW